MTISPGVDAGPTSQPAARRRRRRDGRAPPVAARAWMPPSATWRRSRRAWVCARAYPRVASPRIRTVCVWAGASKYADFPQLSSRQQRREVAAPAPHGPARRVSSARHPTRRRAVVVVATACRHPHAFASSSRPRASSISFKETFARDCAASPTARADARRNSAMSNPAALDAQLRDIYLSSVRAPFAPTVSHPRPRPRAPFPCGEGFSSLPRAPSHLPRLTHPRVPDAPRSSPRVGFKQTDKLEADQATATAHVKALTGKMAESKRLIKEYERVSKEDPACDPTPSPRVRRWYRTQRLRQPKSREADIAARAAAEGRRRRRRRRRRRPRAKTAPPRQFDDSCVGVYESVVRAFVVRGVEGREGEGGGGDLRAGGVTGDGYGVRVGTVVERCRRRTT